MAKEINLEGTGKHNGHAFVDLGLPSGLKWATCNVGASKPEDCGDYFAWGETVAKKDYDTPNYKYYEDICFTTKYDCSDNLTILKASDDAATANWGKGWRMPTKDEMQELIANCTSKRIRCNGRNGYLFTGPNGNSIFLPAVGQRRGKTLHDVYPDDSFLDNLKVEKIDNCQTGSYWSSSKDTTPSRHLVQDTDAWILYFIFDEAFEDRNNCNVYSQMRESGLSVRPVCTK